MAGGGASSSNKTVDRAITAQDSTVMQDSVSAGQLAVVAGNDSDVELNVTDGGAFEFATAFGSEAVGAVKQLITGLGNWAQLQNNFAISSAQTLLTNARAASQESALTSQENTFNFLKWVAAGAAVVGVTYLLTKK